MDIVFAGYMALDATLRLFKENREKILERYPARIEESLADLANNFSGEHLVEFAPDISVYECGAEGIYHDLWHFGEAVGKGFSIDMLSIPVRQETIEICECTGENPYELSSRGCFITETDKGYELSVELREKGIISAVIGCTTKGKARILKKRETISYLNKPR
ncbi:MAG: hypothetical protein IJ608_06235 [Lachnospiraceae bacterium]|nr:hypothetical protein [Lachnospiraceae bacterium]